MDMPDSLFSKPDENSGPAVLGREPVVLPEQRKMAYNKVRDSLDL